MGHVDILETFLPMKHSVVGACLVCPIIAGKPITASAADFLQRSGDGGGGYVAIIIV